MSAPGASSAPAAPGAPTASGRAQGVVRRVLVFLILFALVVIAAIGLSGLLERAIGGTITLAGGTAALAQSLAFTFIGVPLAGLLWWWERRRLLVSDDRASLAWSLYLAAMSTTALVTATVALGSAAAAGIEGRWRPGDLATGVVWAGVWFWHRSLRRSARLSPARLPGLSAILGWVYGVGVFATGAIAALAALVGEALAVVAVPLASSQQWWVPLLQSLVWTALGGLVWWWHWRREGARSASGAFAGVALVIVVGAAAAATLFAIGTVLFVLLRLVFDTAPAAEAIEPLDRAIAAALVGGIVWVIHARVVAARTDATRRGARLVVSAVALIGAASGFGVVVNALLAALTPTLAGDNARTLLLGGLSALVIGLPVWWIAWRPGRAVPVEDAASTARRVYLVAVFGASAITAIVTLLIIGYRIFEFVLDPGGAGGLIERIRGPVGLLAATGIVFAYHFAVWRRDRALAQEAAPERPRTVGRIVLVAATAPADIAERVKAATAASVVLWQATDGAGPVDDAWVARLPAALEGVSAPRALVVAEPDGGVRVIPLAG